MHSYSGSKGTGFAFNSDFSGEVIITKGGETIEISGVDLLEFVAYCYIQPNKISEIEDMSVDQLLITNKKG